jgi:23S rRNA pseudouridine1911/1915/1917 synthase
MSLSPTSKLLSPFQLHDHQANTPVIFEDNHLLVVWKPAGDLVQADHSGVASLQDKLKSYLINKYNKPGDAFVGIVHRLDRNVNGVMIFAKTSKAASRLSDQIRRRVVQKKYLAVVNGYVEKPAKLTHYLKKDSRTNTVSVASPEEKDAKQAILSYTPIAHSEKHSLILVDLVTGRPHQIRVQLAHEGFPVAGDHKYGKNDNLPIHLQCVEMACNHPTQKAWLRFQSAVLFRLFETAFKEDIKTWISEQSNDRDPSQILQNQ